MRDDQFLELPDAPDIEFIDVPATIIDEEVEQHYNPPPAAPLPPAPPPLAAVLAALEPEMRPHTSLACSTCPVATWRRLLRPGANGSMAEGLDCFCQYLHAVTYDSGQTLPLVIDCEGRHRALKEQDGQELDPAADTAPTPDNTP